MRSSRSSRNKRTRKQKKAAQTGGSATLLSPAGLDYQMAPGASLMEYGRFPIEAGTDLPSIGNMDVYFQPSRLQGCGIENSSLHVPASMGSNKVGGRRRTFRKRRHMLRQKKTQRGGNLLESLASQPFLSGAPPNSIQIAANQWYGNTQAIPAPSSASSPTWAYASRGTAGLIDPGFITPIGSDFSKLASPPAWQS